MWSLKISITLISLLSTFAQAIPTEDVIQIIKTTLTPTAKSAHPDTTPILTPFSKLNLTTFSSSIGSLPKILPQRRGIVGGFDDKTLWISRDFPYRTMGRIMTYSIDDQGKEHGMWYCSGTLVGPRHVATVAHCLADGPDKNGKWPHYRSLANYNKQTSLAGSDAIAQYRSTLDKAKDCKGLNDMGVLILAERIGDQVGWMGIEELDLKGEMQKPILSAFGYPGPSLELPMLQEGVQFFEAKCADKAVKADVDWVGGMWGGALIKKEGITYGVMSRGTYDPVDKGVWYATGKPFVGLLNLARTEYA